MDSVNQKLHRVLVIEWQRARSCWRPRVDAHAGLRSACILICVYVEHLAKDLSVRCLFKSVHQVVCDKAVHTLFLTESVSSIYIRIKPNHVTYSCN